MKRSTERILTTHTGSLPRPRDLVDLLFARQAGEPYDETALATRTRKAVAEIVHKQIDAGIDVVGDGEMGKYSYATYATDRLTGFGGAWTRPIHADLAEFPAFYQRSALVAEPSLAKLKTPTCIGPVAHRDKGAVQREIEDFKAALQGAAPPDTFLTAASPGVISLFLRNDYYPTHEAYLSAIAEAMKEEYQAIHAAGFVLQVDCPDLAMGRHGQFASASLDEFRKVAELHVEMLNHALAGIPPDRLRMHLCWGNYEGPHHRDVELRDIVDVVLRARPAAISFEAANPRHQHEWKIWQNVKLPDDKLLIPGVLDTTTNFIEHPELVAERIVRFANLVGRERVIAGTDCGFGTSAGRTTVEEQIVWAKFRAMAEGARLASQQLW